MAIRVAAEPPVDSQRINAPFPGKKTDRRNINFRAREVIPKWRVDPIIVGFHKDFVWNYIREIPENLDFDLRPITLR